MSFRVADAPLPTDWKRLEDRYPENPFCTALFIESYREQGLRPLLLELEDRSGCYVACAAFLNKGALTQQIIIHSAPDVPQGTASFWPAVADFCRRMHVSELEVDTFGSLSSTIPDLGHVLWRRPRVEFVLDLDRHSRNALATNHKRNLAKAERAGMTIRTTNTDAACKVHAELMKTSLARREALGEQVTSNGEEFARTLQLVKTGAGTLFQTVRDSESEVLSSMLVLKAKRGAYYHSAGSSAKGMELGSSHLLVRTIAEMLKAEGILRFNLGGAHSEGLRRFKAGFGARAVELESAGFSLAGRAHRQVLKVLRAVRGHIRK
jgi:GNAT acetyltransferase-like protein